MPESPIPIIPRKPIHFRRTPRNFDITAYLEIPSKALIAAADVSFGSPERAKLEEEVLKLRTKLGELSQSLQAANEEGGSKEAKLKAYEAKLHEMELGTASLHQKQDLAYLLNRVSDQAEKKLLDDENFRQEFTEQRTCNAFVLSIDIRRSTDLMLRGKTPQRYAEFLNTVCTELVAVIKSNFGVIDKFTGDGLLAYFPMFFSGDDSGYRSLAAAQAAHAVFAKNYRDHRSSFTSVLRDAGLGIGIDFGEVRLLRVTGELTVVGTAVVYACRLGGAPAGMTYMNNSAVDELRNRCPDAFEESEVDFDIKHEGAVICHEVRLSHASYEPRLPTWLASLSDTREVAT